jgi:hypothetical protein
VDDDVHGWRRSAITFSSYGGRERFKRWWWRFDLLSDEALQNGDDMARETLGVLTDVDVDTSVVCNAQLE